MFNAPTRNHISIIIERLGFIIALLAFNVISNVSNSPEKIFSVEYWRSVWANAAGAGDFIAALSGFAFILICGVVLFISFLIWRKTFFYIDGADFVFEKRTIFKKNSRLAIVNISTVNIERNVFERLVGTAKVKLDLNSAKTSERTDFTFVLKAPLAQILQEELINKKQGLLDSGNTAAVNTNQFAQPLPANEQKQETVFSSPSSTMRSRSFRERAPFLLS